jgi:hypothetical protein
MVAITAVSAILSEVANLVLGKVWTAVSQSWYTTAAAVFFIARPFLIAAISVWGLKKAAEIQGRSLEKAAEIQGRSLEKAARILAQRQQQDTVGNVRQVSAGGTTMVGLRARAASAPHSSPFYITHR